MAACAVLEDCKETEVFVYRIEFTNSSNISLLETLQMRVSYHRITALCCCSQCTVVTVFKCGFVFYLLSEGWDDACGMFFDRCRRICTKAVILQIYRNFDCFVKSRVLELISVTGNTARC